MEDKEFWRSEKVAFLALASVKGIGFWTIHKIAQSGVGYKDTLRDPEKAGLSKILSDALFDGIDGQERLWLTGLGLARQLAASGVSVLFKDESAFPSKLREIPDAPEWLFIQGKLENLTKRSMTIVGTRKPSADGLFLTKLVVASLARSKIVTVSGLALGIDQIAHSESIRFNLPTVAVLGTGILQNYPKGSETLRNEIIESGGTIVSEYLPHQSYSAENFVRRNRIQAALGNVLVPTEWQIKSGTAHTVRFAHKYGRSIVNVCLPGTQEYKPELEYSANEYGAKTLELPIDIYGLWNALGSYNNTENNIDQSTSTEVAEEFELKPDATPDNGELATEKTKQLPLL